MPFASKLFQIIGADEALAIASPKEGNLFKREEALRRALPLGHNPMAKLSLPQLGPLLSGILRGIPLGMECRRRIPTVLHHGHPHTLFKFKGSGRLDKSLLILHVPGEQLSEFKAVILVNSYRTMPKREINERRSHDQTPQILTRKCAFERLWNGQQSLLALYTEPHAM